VRTLLGGIALYPCGNIAVGGQSHAGHHVYRCSAPTRDPARPGPHVARAAAPVDEFIRNLIIARMSRDDAADLITAPASGTDVTALREEAAAIHSNLEEMAADRALGLIGRAQMLAATERANYRLTQISDQLTEAGRETSWPNWSPPATSPPPGTTVPLGVSPPATGDTRAILMTGDATPRQQVTGHA
jgi:site-specific DNA recombinase